MDGKVKDGKVEFQVMIMRYPVLMEDEGRTFVVKGPLLKSEAEEWIKAQKNEYFKPSDYYLLNLGPENG